MTSQLQKDLYGIIDPIFNLRLEIAHQIGSPAETESKKQIDGIPDQFLVWGKMYDALQNLVPGDHAALFYRNRTEQFECMIPFIRIGLQRNEKCLYVAGDNSVHLVLQALASSGLDVDRYTASGALVVTTVQEAFLKSGIFEPTKLVDDLAKEVSVALEAGYSGLRGTGEMLWSVKMPDALQCLHQYEMRLDELFPDKFTAICQYKEQQFPQELLSQMLLCHPKIIVRNRLLQNSYYLPPGELNCQSAPTDFGHAIEQL